MTIAGKQGRCVMTGVYLLSTLAVVLWGLSYIWSDAVMALGVPVEYLVFVRIFVAALVLLALNLIVRSDIRMRLKDLPLFLLLSLFEPLIYFVCETYGIKLTESPTYSALIIASGPIFSVGVGIFFFKEKFSLLNMCGILVCLAGIVLVTICSSSVGKAFWIGMVLLVVAVLSEVGHASVVKILSDRYSPTVIVMYQFLIGSVWLLPLFLTRGIRDFDPAVYLSWDVWRPVLCLAILCSSIAFSLWANTIKYLGVAKSSIFMSTIPVITALAGYMFGHEILSDKQWLGIFIACLGVAISQINPKAVIGTSK